MVSWMQLALGAQHGTISEIACDGRGVERRRHHDQPQFRSSRGLKPAQERQREIALQMPLMKFIQDDGTHAVEMRIGQQAASQHALGQEPKPRARAAHVFESHLVAGGFAELLAQFAGDAPRRHTRGQSPRLQHQNLAARVRQQRGRDSRGLARSGRRFDHQTGMARQRFDDPRQQNVDRQLHSSKPPREWSRENFLPADC